MNRQALTDDSGRWFDIDKAERFSENTYWNGNNHISCATGDQFYHESLWRTKSGIWVLHEWSDWQGSMETWSEIDDDEAAKWLIKNDHESDIVKEQIEALEI